MERKTFVAVFTLFRKRTPFLPFTLELVNGSRMEVNHPEAVTLYDTFLTYNSTRGIRSVTDYGSVVRIIEATGTV